MLHDLYSSHCRIALLLKDLAAVVTHEAPVPDTMATGRDGLAAQIAVDAANRSAFERGDTCRLGA